MWGGIKRVPGSGCIWDNGGTWAKGIIPALGIPGIPHKSVWTTGSIPILEAIDPSVLTTSRFTTAAAFGGGGGAGFGFVWTTGAFASNAAGTGAGGASAGWG